jgi:polysaccharide deacetylase family protein (PEP-CTERM system associated)
MPPFFILSIDVEDWFQVENFKAQVPFNTWDQHQLRVERNTHRLLDLLDSVNLIEQHPRDGFSGTLSSSHEQQPSATFFILGWLAKRLPGLVREIQARGHEIASHGYTHDLCSNLSIENLRSDLLRSKHLLEDIAGTQIYGYRAPSFSINNNILKHIEDCGYTYDASYNSFSSHGRYGKLHTNSFQNIGIAYRVSDTFYELPVSNWRILSSFSNKIGQYSLPWGGGGYFRLIPKWIFHQGVHFIVKREAAYHFYMHPWEIDPWQPRVHGLPKSYRFRHYINLHRTETKLKKLLCSFSKCRICSCKDYLERVTNQPVIPEPETIKDDL